MMDSVRVTTSVNSPALAVSFTSTGRRVAGAMKKAEDAPYPDSWSVYVLSPDATAAAAKIAEAGGTNMFEPMSVPGMGVMGFATDPTGGTVGYWQPGEHGGFQVEQEHGALVWSEVLAHDFDKVVEFYEKAFGWTLEDLNAPDMRYKVFTKDGQQICGIYDVAGTSAEGEPSGWAVYFGADDVDATVAKAVELGATVKEEAQDTAYGRIAVVTDPTGAVLRVMSFRPQE